MGPSQFISFFKWQGFLHNLLLLRSSRNSYFVFWLNSCWSFICLHFYTSIYGFFVTILSKHLTRRSFTLRALLLGFFFQNFSSILLQYRLKILQDHQCCETINLREIISPATLSLYIVPASNHLLIVIFLFFFPLCNIKNLLEISDEPTASLSSSIYV